MLYDTIGSKVSRLASWFMKTIAGLAMFVACGFMNAFTLMKLWNWFVVLACNVKPISVLLAYGLYTIFSLLTMHFAKVPAEPEVDHNGEPLVFRTMLMTFANQLGISGSALLMGYIIHCWL